MILLFIPIGIMVDIAEKIDKIKEKEVPIRMVRVIREMWVVSILLVNLLKFFLEILI